MIRDLDIVYVIVADCGGGDDYNPHTSLESAMARIEPDETGIEIWRMTFAEYEANSRGEVDVTPGECVWSRW